MDKGMFFIPGFVIINRIVVFKPFAAYVYAQRVNADSAVEAPVIVEPFPSIMLLLVRTKVDARNRYIYRA